MSGVKLILIKFFSLNQGPSHEPPKDIDPGEYREDSSPNRCTNDRAKDCTQYGYWDYKTEDKRTYKCSNAHGYTMLATSALVLWCQIPKVFRGNVVFGLNRG